MKNLILVLTFLPIFAWSQKFPLSERAEISVITCGPSQDELYTAFGHSAIRVYDPETAFDAAYNYGVFDFDQPNFYLNFAKGFLYYKLGVSDYGGFKNYYIYKNRYVHEQILNLSQAQKQTLFDYLQTNALPRNQSYRYDYFYNNCATKIRDVVEAALGTENVTFDGSHIKTKYSIRDLTDIYLKDQPWGDLGIDICLGLPMDKVASPYEYMFLPDYIESGFDHAFIANDSGKAPLVKKKNIIYEVRAQEEPVGLPHPLYFSIGLAILAAILAILDIQKNSLSLWFDSLLFGISGAVGFLLFFLWFFTDHNAAAKNMNLLWAMPTHLIAVIMFLKNPKWLRSYFFFAIMLSGATLLFWGLLPQELHYALIPVAIAQTIRAYAQYKLRKEKAPERSRVATSA